MNATDWQTPHTCPRRTGRHAFFLVGSGVFCTRTCSAAARSGRRRTTESRRRRRVPFPCCLIAIGLGSSLLPGLIYPPSACCPPPLPPLTPLPVRLGPFEKKTGRSRKRKLLSPANSIVSFSFFLRLFCFFLLYHLSFFLLFNFITYKIGGPRISPAALLEEESWAFFFLPFLIIFPTYA